jgi:hypothetical protein
VRQDNRGGALVLRKEGVGLPWKHPKGGSFIGADTSFFAYAEDVCRDGPVRWILTFPLPTKFDPPSPPAGVITKVPTISRTEFPGEYKTERPRIAGTEVIPIYGHHGGRIIVPRERKSPQFIDGAPRWKPGPHKLAQPPEYAQRPHLWRVRLPVVDTETVYILHFESWPMCLHHRALAAGIRGDGFVMLTRGVYDFPVIKRRPWFVYWQPPWDHHHHLSSGNPGSSVGGPREEQHEGWIVAIARKIARRWGVPPTTIINVNGKERIKANCVEDMGPGGLDRAHCSKAKL